MIKYFPYKTVIVKILFLLLIYDVYAQESPTYTVSGTLTDSAGVVDFATLTVLSRPDSAYITSTISNSKGKFEFKNLPQGQFILCISHLLYEKKFIDISLPDNTVMDTIRMTAKTNELNEVVVSPQFINHQPDRYNISLQGNPVAKGKTAGEVIGLLPGVYTQDNNIIITGRNVSNIYINDRKITDRKELHAIQAEYIDNIEVIYTTGSEYKASEMGGIIKIKLKKNHDYGYYGSVSSGITFNTEYGNTNDDVDFVFNYGKNKINIYNYLRYNDFKNISNYDITTNYLNSQQLISTILNGTERNHDFSENMNIFYSLNEQHTLGGNVRVSVSNAFPSESSVSNLLNPDESTKKTFSETTGTIKKREYQAALDYFWKINERGSTFRLKADYLRYKKADTENYIYTYPMALPSSEQMKNDLGQITTMFETDAVLKLKIEEKHTLDMGIQYSSDNTKRNLDYRIFENGAWVHNTDLTDKFNLLGNEYAAYATFSSSINKFSYKIGMRGQASYINYNSLKINQLNKKSYFGLYPSVDLSYNINQEAGNLLRLSYQRKRNDIPYSAISPVIVYNNPFSYSKGNLDLKPPVFNALEATMILKNDWTVYLLFVRGDGIIHYQTFTDENNPLVTYAAPVNGSQLSAYCGGIDGTVHIRKWWNCKGSLNLEWMHYKQDNRVAGKEKAVKAYFELKNDFRWNKGWGGNLAWYGEPLDYKYFERTYKGTHSLSGKVYKYLWNNSLQVSLNFVLYAKNRVLITEKDDIIINRKYTTNQTCVELMVVYNINKGKKIKNNRFRGSLRYNELKDN
jgi:hypothetical protein